MKPWCALKQRLALRTDNSLEPHAMNKFTALTFAASLAASLLSMTAMAAERTAAPAPVAGEKVDSGLGDLPHYSKWADPTGKNPTLAKVVVVAKRDDKQARRPSVEVSQAK
jgi:hypothetical protein